MDFRGRVCVCVLVEGESDGGGANDRSEAGRVDMIRRAGGGVRVNITSRAL